MSLPTFNSNFEKRPVPLQNWKGVGITTLIIVLISTLGWEYYLRTKGVTPHLDDNKELWANVRSKLLPSSKQTVFIGSSRVFHGINLSVWEREFKQKPLQLSSTATTPRFYLEHLAFETNFQGILVMGVTPSIFFNNFSKITPLRVE